MPVGAALLPADDTRDGLERHRLRESVRQFQKQWRVAQTQMSAVFIEGQVAGQRRKSRCPLGRGQAQVLHLAAGGVPVDTGSTLQP